MPGKKVAEVLSGVPLFQIAGQQALNGVRHFTGRAAISNWPAKARTLAHGPAQAEIIGVLDAPVDLELLAFQADIGNAVLAATVRAAGDIELQLLVKRRQALLQLFHQPSRKGLRLSDGEFAELAAGAGHSPAPEC